MNPDDIQDLMGPFLAEAQEFLQVLETQLLELESATTPKTAELAVRALFRAAHSLKGSALMFGFTQLATTSHRLEDCFGILRDQVSDLTELDPDVMTALLQGTDYLKAIMSRVAKGEGLEEEDPFAQEAIGFVAALYEQLTLQYPVETVNDERTLAGPGIDQSIVQAIFEYELPPVLAKLETQLVQLQPETLADSIETLKTLQGQLAGAARILQIGTLEHLVSDFNIVLSKPTHTVETLHNEVNQILEALKTGRDRILDGELMEWAGLESLSVSADANTEMMDPLPDLTGSDDLFSHFLGPGQHEPLIAQPKIDSTDTVASDGPWNQEDDLFSSSFMEALPASSDDLFNSDSMTETVEMNPAVEDPVELRDLLSESEDLKDGLTMAIDPVPSALSPLDKPMSKPVPVAKSVGLGSLTPRPTIRVDLQELNELVNLVGELVINRTNLEVQENHLRTESRRMRRQITALQQAGGELREEYDRLTLPQSHHTTTAARATDFDSLEMDQYTEFHTTAQSVIDNSQVIGESATTIDALSSQFENSLDQLRRITDQLRNRVMQLRVVPFSRVVDHLPRAVRDMGRTYSKDINLLLLGRETRIDESLLEALREPLLHLVRNAFDHGIESAEERRALGKPISGQIEIEARHQGGQTLITVTDDGRGINPETIRQKVISRGLVTPAQGTELTTQECYDFLFLPGFSTASQVSDLSGRGVGLDVVKVNLQQVRGSIRLDSQVGRGTTFTLRLPLMLSIVPALMVVVQHQTLAIPLDAVEEILTVSAQAIQYVGRQPLLAWQGDFIRLLPLTELLHYGTQAYGSPDLQDDIPLLILSSGDDIAAIQVDRLLGQQEIVVKPIPDPLVRLPGIVGSTILGSGEVVLILDIAGLFGYGDPSGLQQARATLDPLLFPEEVQESDPVSPATPMNVGGTQPAHILIVDDAYAIRQLVGRALKRAQYIVTEAKDGQDALDQLRRGLRCDAIITDLEMPRMDGFELVRALKADANLHSLPIAVLTSRTGSKHRQLATELGVETYLTKPYREPDLLKTVAQLLH